MGFETQRLFRVQEVPAVNGASFLRTWARLSAPKRGLRLAVVRPHPAASSGTTQHLKLLYTTVWPQEDEAPLSGPRQESLHSRMVGKRARHPTHGYYPETGSSSRAVPVEKPWIAE